MNLLRLAAAWGVLTLALPLATRAQTTAPAAKPVVELPAIHVEGEAGQGPAVSEALNPALGANTYTITERDIDQIAQGENTPFNQVLVHAPGVSFDTYGAIHLRNEDPYYYYYINGTRLPDGINGFSQDIDTRFVKSVTVEIGALPAYYAEGNYGVVDITTKTGAELNGAVASFYGGSNDTLHPSFSYGGTSHGTDFYITGSFVHDDLGLENPTPGTRAIHDQTDQYRGMAYLSHQFDGGGRLSFVFSGADNNYEIPNTPGQAPAFDFSGTTDPPTVVDSTSLNERQNEQTYYGFIAYQQSFDDWSFQVSQVNRDSTVKFNPDVNGDLLFNGVAASVDEYLFSNGVQADFTWQAASDHTVRYGMIAETQQAGTHNQTQVYRSMTTAPPPARSSPSLTTTPSAPTTTASTSRTSGRSTTSSRSTSACASSR